MRTFAAVLGSLAFVAMVSCHDESSSSFTVTPSATYVTISPSTPQAVSSGGAQTFTVTADAGYGIPALVGGTCPAGAWNATTYTTGAVTADCTITFAGAWSGIKHLGAASAQTVGSGIAVDSSGNVIIAGYTDGGLDGNTVAGSRDAYVTKYDRSGTKLWTHQIGESSTSTLGNGVAVDPSGNIFITGETDAGLDGNTLTGANDAFVVKLDSSGTTQWTKQLGVASKNTIGNSVTTDAAGNVFIAGITTGGLDSNPLTGLQDFFLAKYDSSGTKQWVRQLGASSANTTGQGVASDASGNLFVAGWTSGNLDGNTKTGLSDFFLTKYNAFGTKQWTKQLGVSSKNTQANAVATDPSGNIVISGYTTGALDGNSLIGSQDFFVTKYDTLGARQWTKELGVASVPVTVNDFAIATDSAGYIFTGGSTNGALDGQTLTGVRDAFVTKYDASGTKLWTRQFGGVGTTAIVNGLATNASGEVFLGGYADGDLDGMTLLGNDDFIVAKLDGSGTKQ